MKVATAGRAAALGALSGMRSTAGLAALSVGMRRRRAHNRGARIVATKAARRLLPIVATGEMIADKLPFIGDRTKPLPMAGRALFGALAGGIVATEERSSMLLGAAIGALTAVAVTHLAYRARKYAHERFSLPDALLAGVEDALVIGVGALAARR